MDGKVVESALTFALLHLSLVVVLHDGDALSAVNLVQADIVPAKVCDGLDCGSK
jgi:hypothetical protein